MLVPTVKSSQDACRDVLSDRILALAVDLIVCGV